MSKLITYFVSSVILSSIFLIGAASSALAASNCNRSMLRGDRWTEIRCIDVDNNGSVETVALYMHRAGSVSEVVFAADGRQISSRKLSRQERMERVAALSNRCRTIRNIASMPKLIYKARQSNHIPRFDPRKNGVSLISMRAGGPSSSLSCIKGYKSNGTQVVSLGQYRPSGSLYAWRAYTGWGCGPQKTPAQLYSSARNGVYFNYSGSICAFVPNVRQCYNSSGC